MKVATTMSLSALVCTLGCPRPSPAPARDEVAAGSQTEIGPRVGAPPEGGRESISDEEAPRWTQDERGRARYLDEIPEDGALDYRRAIDVVSKRRGQYGPAPTESPTGAGALILNTLTSEALPAETSEYFLNALDRELSRGIGETDLGTRQLLFLVAKARFKPAIPVLVKHIAAVKKECRVCVSFSFAGTERYNTPEKALTVFREESAPALVACVEDQARPADELWLCLLQLDRVLGPERLKAELKSRGSLAKNPLLAEKVPHLP